jgi:hypothetical protein
MAAYLRTIEGQNMEDKIHCTASKRDETWLKSSLAIFIIMQKYNNWMIFARLCDKKQIRRQNMVDVVFWWGGGVK